MQFVSTDLDWQTPADDHDFADVLAGRLVWRDYVSCFRDGVTEPRRS